MSVTGPGELVVIAVVAFAVLSIGAALGVGVVVWAVGWEHLVAAYRGDDPDPDPPVAREPLRLVWSAYDAPAARSLISQEGPAA